MKSENIFDIELRISSDWPEEQRNSCLISIFKREELEKSIVIMADSSFVKTSQNPHQGPKPPAITHTQAWIIHKAPLRGELRYTMYSSKNKIV